MSTPYNYIDATGVIVPDTSDILAQVQSEWRTAYGQDLSVSADTPQGVQISGETAARVGVIENNAAVANQLNPRQAGGPFLDAICALMSLYRILAVATRSPAVLLSGVARTPVPAGAKFQTEAGDIFASAGNVILNDAGQATVDFIAVQTGPVPIALGAAVRPIDTIFGWETATITHDPVIGNDEQSDPSLLALRETTLANQGISSVDAQISNVAILPGVKSSTFRENLTDADVVIDGIAVGKRSVWNCVDGGTDLAIATALLAAKTSGSGWTGADVVNVQDPKSGQTYEVKFDRPALVDILIRVTLRPGKSTLDPLVVIPKALTDYQDGAIPGVPGFIVGSQISPFELGGACVIEAPGMFIVKVEIAPVSTGIFQTTELPVALNQKGSFAESAITVVVE